MSIITSAINRNLFHSPIINASIRLIKPEAKEFSYMIEQLAESFPQFNQRLIERKMELEEYFRSESQNRALFISERQGMMVGASHASLIEEQVKIEGIFVKPRIRGQGIGREMLSKMVTWGKERGANSLLIEVSQQYEHSHTFFKRYDPNFKVEEQENGHTIFTKPL